MPSKKKMEERETGSSISEPAGRGHWRTYGVFDGLASGAVWSLLQDREGPIWVGTYHGLNRFDGSTISTFTTEDGLVDNRIWAMCQDREGHLWIGTQGGGVSHYDGETFTSVATYDEVGWVRSIIQDRDGYIWFGTSKGAIRYDGEGLTAFTVEDGLPHDSVWAIFQDREGRLWIGTQEGLSRYVGGTFTTFTAEDGLLNNRVNAIAEDGLGGLWIGTVGGMSRYDGRTFNPFFVEEKVWEAWVTTIVREEDETLWIGTQGDGVSRYDGDTFTTFTTEDGLADNAIISAIQDREGHLWFGTYGSGLSRYDDRTFLTFTSDAVLSILEDREGYLWFGTNVNGVYRYDGQSWRTYTTEEGLASNKVNTVFQDRDGYIWFATGQPDGTEGVGVSRYDGQGFENFTTENGLVDDRVHSISQDHQGYLWFGTHGGMSRYDGEVFSTVSVEDGLNQYWRKVFIDRQGNFWFYSRDGVSRFDGERYTTFTAKDGLAHDWVRSVVQDSQGHFWFSTLMGVSRYDGKTWTSYTHTYGQALQSLNCSYVDRDGHLWFGNLGCGVRRCDGEIFQTLTTGDGMGSNTVYAICQDRKGDLWFGTASGVTRFHPPESLPPSVHIAAVVADRRYEDAAEVTASADSGFIVFELRGMDFKTRADAMIYRYRLRGYDRDWQSTRSQRVEYQDIPQGTYTFEVVAVDRDLVYSEQPATVDLQVVPDPRDEQIDELERRVRERTRELEETHRQLEETQSQLIDELERELQTAHELQMRLMPAESPRIEGFAVAGRCIPANHVGGDFFQYFARDGRLFVCMADVTGHAMEAAVPVMMFSGILEMEMRSVHPLDELFGHLNRALHSKLDSRTYVCFAMGEVDLDRHTLLLGNSGCPYPFHYDAAAGGLVELQIDAYPLGVRPDTTYATLQTRLGLGDCVVFCSDGIIEAAGAAGEIFGFERTAETIGKGCEEGLAAEKLIDRLIGAVQDYTGDAHQEDDMTVVVLKRGG